MINYYLGLGSNLGDSIKTLTSAIYCLKKFGQIAAISSCIITPPLPVPDHDIPKCSDITDNRSECNDSETDSRYFAGTQNDFHNCVIELCSQLTPLELLAVTQELECQFGREKQRKLRWQPRSLDIDILFMTDYLTKNCLFYKSPTLIIPHPELTKREFVLYNLAEIAPDCQYPVVDKTIGQLYSEIKQSFYPQVSSFNELTCEASRQQTNIDS